MLIPLTGLGLGGCGADTVERALRRVPGVLEVYVNRAAERAYVTYRGGPPDAAALQRAIEAAGARAESPDTWAWAG